MMEWKRIHRPTVSTVKAGSSPQFWFRHSGHGLTAPTRKDGRLPPQLPPRRSLVAKSLGTHRRSPLEHLRSSPACTGKGPMTPDRRGNLEPRTLTLVSVVGQVVLQSHYTRGRSYPPSQGPRQATFAIFGVDPGTGTQWTRYA